MKRIALTLMAILLMVFPLFSQTTSAHTSTDSKVDSTGWKSLMDMPTGRFAHSATVFDGKIYVFGGLENGYGPFSNSVEVYDPESDTWTKLANMPTPRCHLSTSLLDGKIYAIGGWSNPTDRDGLKTVEVYDPISDSWVKGTDMPLPRLEFHSCVFDDKIYVFGGLDASEKGLNRVEVYDPESDKWTQLEDMPTGRCAHSCILKDSLIYVFGGTPGVGPYFDPALNVVEIYNPRTDTWEEGVEMPEGKSSFSATLFNDMLYTFGGTRELPDDNSLALFEIFDFSKNKWLSAPDIPTARKLHTASLIDGKIYVIGGCNTPPSWPGLSKVEVFTIGDRSVTIPDTAFLNALIEEGVDTNEDGQISYVEAELVTQLGLNNGAITDMTGIEAFVNLDTLYCFGNLLTSLDFSSNTALTFLHCSGNQLTSLDVSGCTALTQLYCSGNQLTSLDVSNNTALYYLNFSDMPTLFKVCVWEMPFPLEDDLLNMEGSPNVYFTTECSDFEAPLLMAADSLYQPDNIEATSSEDGVIYLVPENTVAHLGLIRALCIDSVVVISNAPSNISLSGLDNGIYWLYARDSTGNISEPKVIAITGVGIQQRISDQFRLFPNPTGDLLTIETEYPDHYSINITSLNGQQILFGEMEGSSHQIDLSTFHKGVYFITLRSKDFLTNRKIIKL